MLLICRYTLDSRDLEYMKRFSICYDGEQNFSKTREGRLKVDYNINESNSDNTSH